jgi:hypothetical protein
MSIATLRLRPRNICASSRLHQRKSEDELPLIIAQRRAQQVTLFLPDEFTVRVHAAAAAGEGSGDPCRGDVRDRNLDEDKAVGRSGHGRVDALQSPTDGCPLTMHPVDLGERKADKWVLRVVAVCLMAMSLLLLALAVRPVFPVDDAFISFRYALNWIRGLGLVFTEGERVEGYSNFLWVLLVGAGARVGVTPPLAARLFSMTCLLTMLALLACRHGSSGQGPGAFGAAAATVVALSPHTTLNVLSGLEAPLVALLLLGSLLALDAERVWLASCLLLLLALTRPEGVVLGTVILLAAFLSRPAGTRQAAVMAFVAGFLMPFAVYSAWRWGYYGSLVPNSIAAKSGMDTWEILRRSAGYELAFLKTYVPIGGLSLAGIALALKGQRSRRLIVPCIAALATLSALNFYIGAGDPYVLSDVISIPPFRSWRSSPPLPPNTSPTGATHEVGTGCCCGWRRSSCSGFNSWSWRAGSAG